MVNSDRSIFEYEIPPFVQVGAVLIVIVIFMLVSSGSAAVGLSDADSGTPWLIAVAMTFFFTIANSVLSLAADDLNKYWWQSILSYVLLAFLGGGIAYLFSGDSMDVHGTYRWLYIMFSMGHIFFLALLRTMRKIVTIAKEQDSKLRGED